ncbi:MAG: ATPase, T2SS/T4P/T4SS family [Acidimicrobiia bacterium]
MGLVERVSRAIALGTTSLDPDDVAFEANRLLAAESPWHGREEVQGVVHRVTGLGPVQDLFEDPDVTDVLVNGPDEIWVDRGSDLERVERHFGSDEDIVATVERVIAPLGLRIDRASPMVDARLADGSRLHAVLPPAAVDAPLVAIRRFTQRVADLDDLVTTGTATSDQVDRMTHAVESRQTIVISGGTGAGKTTLLNLLAGKIDQRERVVTVEDAAELDLPGHIVRLEARPANAEGAGEITIRTLLRSALRLRPDRIVVGEVRGGEALDLITALNTGHRGSMTTVHANSPEEALWRLETLALMAGDASEAAVRRQLRAAVDLVVQIERGPRGRRIDAIAGRDDLEGSGA